MRMFIKKEEKYTKILTSLVFILLLFLLSIIFFQKIDLNSSDLGRHLENGKIVWHNTNVLYQNFYSYTYTNYPFINHHWLSGVVYYGVYLIGGFKLLTILNIFLILSTFFLIFSFSRKKIGLALSAFISLPVIFLLGERTEVRPEIFSYLLFFLLWLIIYKAEKNKKVLYFLTPLFLLWVNLHIYFFLGLLLLAIKAGISFLEGYFSDKKDRINRAWQKSRLWFKWLFISILVSLLNPNTIHGLLYPFNILKGYGYEIAENKSVFFLQNIMINPRFLIFKLLVLFFIVSWIAHFILSKKYKWFELFASIMILSAALIFSRNISFFALVVLFVSGTILLEASWIIRGIFSKIRGMNLIVYGVIIIITLTSILYFIINNQSGTNNFLKQDIGWGLNNNDNASFKFFLNNHLQGPIFNDYDIGSAMIFNLYPQEKVFVDNRPEAYPAKFFKEVYIPMQDNEISWEKYSKEYKINCIYFSHRDSTSWAVNFIRNRLQDKDWVLVYFDQYNLILLKNVEKNKTIIDKYKIGFWQFRNQVRELSNKSDIAGKLQLADLAISDQQFDLAEEIYKEVLFKHPHNKRVLSSLGFLYAQDTNIGDDTKAISYLKQALKEGLKLPNVYNKLGLLYWNRQDYKMAEYYWRKSLSVDENNKNALDYLKQMKQFKMLGKINY